MRKIFLSFLSVQHRGSPSWSRGRICSPRGRRLLSCCGAGSTPRCPGTGPATRTTSGCKYEQAISHRHILYVKKWKVAVIFWTYSSAEGVSWGRREMKWWSKDDQWRHPPPPQHLKQQQKTCQSQNINIPRCYTVNNKWGRGMCNWKGQHRKTVFDHSNTSRMVT